MESRNRSKEILQKILSRGDIKINGDRPWDIEVLHEEFYSRVLSGGSLALGESYMDGWWNSDSVDSTIERIVAADLQTHTHLSFREILHYAYAYIVNQGSKKRAFNIGERHYDIGNDLFKVMLDKRMVYTCGYWKEAKDLDEAQEQKLDLVCKKIHLKAGQTVLDIGCGWGSFAKFAAEKYGAKVVGITVSIEQAELARELCKGLPIDIRLQDYRDLREKFDHVVSLGMFEHVGRKNYHSYMEVVHRSLKDQGLFLLHTLGANKPTRAGDPWTSKYIFPGGMLPAISDIGKVIEGKFIMEDWHNFGADYDETLLAWFKNFDQHWPELKEKYGERFYRMWKYYLMAFSGSLRARKVQLWQIVLSKDGVRGGYESVR